jgi:hypothetical protein
MSLIEECSRRLSVTGVLAGMGEAGMGDTSANAAVSIGDWYVEVHRTLNELGHEFGAGTVQAATDLTVAAFDKGLIYPGPEALQFIRELAAKIWSAHPHNVRSTDRSSTPRY